MNIINAILQKTLIQCVKFYQKFISPYKGYQCAHGVHTGTISCSGYGMKALKSNEPLVALSLIRQRTKACSHIYHLYKPAPINNMKVKHPLYHKQAGFCDACDVPCDSPNCDSPCDSKPGKLSCLDAVHCCEIDGNSKNNHTVNSNFAKKTDSSKKTIKNFQLIDEDGEWLIYYHKDNFYYKIHETSVVESEENILNNKTKIPTAKLTKEEFINFIKERKNKINLSKK